MKNKILSFVFLVFTTFSFAQVTNTLWKSTVKKIGAVTFENKSNIKNPQLFELELNTLKKALSKTPKRFVSTAKSNVIVSFPITEGTLEKFSIKESTNMDPELSTKYPEIKSYVGQGIDNPNSTLYFSISPLGFYSMLIKADQTAVFIEPYTKDLSSYVVYTKSDKIASLNKFECKIIAATPSTIKLSLFARPNADDGKLRNFRLALSVTGEYTTYFGGTKALALAAINNSMTRVNGIFEKDFGIHMNLIANNDLVIYTSASTDPYSAATTGSNGAWNQELQTALTSTIGNANYDIGHLFGASGGGGNAGCIACVCVNPTTAVPLGKGSGFTSPSDGIPSGDNFDVDYVAHEMGHQFGGNHTFTHSNEGTGVQMEPGSGSTIMGYAGITTLDIQAHSDPYFHAISVQQITNYIKTTTCQTTTVTGNSIPTAGAGLDYTVPKSTPFMLTGTGTDANGDALTYDWEQMDSQNTAAAPSATKTSGVNFRSYNPTTSPTRYFPKMSSALTGATTTAGLEITTEALPSVARSLNFRVTVRDNRAGGPANNSDDMIVTVNATAGPFTVSSPNTAVSYVGNSIQTVTWAVAGTTSNGVNCANVDILISTNAGSTWTTLLAATPNDGTQAVTIPNTAGTQNRIMVKGNNHIFFDVSNTNFTITAAATDTTAPTAPTSLTASGTTQTSTNLSWTAATDNVAVTGYDIYQGATLKGSTTTATIFAITGLTASTAYTFIVKAKDAAGNVSVASNTASVTTLAASDTTAPSAPTNLATSGTTQTSTNLSWTAATDNVGVTGYDVYQGATLKGSTTTATTLAITGLTASTAYTFIVKAKDAAGNVSVASNTASVTTLAASDTTAPSTPTNLAASGTTQTTTNLSWIAATDNVAVTGYDVYQGASLIGSTTTETTFAVSGLTASTAYTFTVKAKDAAGNVSIASNTASVTTNSVFGGGATDLIFSEYIEGTSFNKALEIANNTGSAVDLSVYTVKKQTNGAGTWSSGLALSGSLNTGAKFVIVHSSIALTCYSTSSANISTAANEMTYNGNDAIGLFKNGVLIDIIGTFNGGTANFAIDVTIRRKTNITSPNSTFNLTAEWDSYAIDSCGDLGSRFANTAAKENSSLLNDFKIYPNPVKGDVLHISFADNASYRIINTLGQEITKGKIENGSLSVSKINAGVYLLEVSNNGSTTVKRFIKQ
ncbi:reprolysin-like metallopeptidase [Flavobacterium luteum]|uniref:T9SS type A sorting domain-containing protein n=1 Tax=Flavobacterium luteum TaxID=2026654 RepID=A0A7J5AJY5_9FLAO|nr:zinc-dependent metalloprotease family protein [Flavobacterium luteum]KAB1157914.1 T9SS type A sorting domain-containing protein [Flavobacterium luteum]